MKYPKTITKLLHNKTVFYIVTFFAVANILGYVFLGNFAGVFIFLIVGSLTYLFNRNKTIVLLVPLLITSLFMMGKTVKEGLENKKTDKKSEKNEKNEKESKDKKSIEPTSNSSGIITGPVEDTSAKPLNDSEPEPEPNVVQTDGMSNKKGGNQWNKNRIDHAATIEEAYGNLSNILGSDGIKGLTNDTQKLMKQQLQLAEAMKGMMPVVEQAQNMMKGLDLKSFDIKGLADMAKQFSPSKV